MKVVFLEEVPGSGYPGDVKDVADGYARNYLLPRKLATAANKQMMQKATKLADIEARRQAKLDNEASGIAEALNGQTLTFIARVGDLGRLFGSITAGDIATKATELAGEEVDRHKIHLGEPIKETGVRTVKVRLTRNIEVDLNIDVRSHDQPAEEEPAAETASEETSEVEAELTEGTGEETPVADEQPAEVAEAADAPEEPSEATLPKETAEGISGEAAEEGNKGTES
ncbi:MAG: 50S ribosomal protein L9 [Dehalococcoidia bacterium]